MYDTVLTGLGVVMCDVVRDVMCLQRLIYTSKWFYKYFAFEHIDM